jgi:hypothetical protein
MAVAKNNMPLNWPMTIVVGSKMVGDVCEVTFGTRAGLEFVLTGRPDGTEEGGIYIYLNDEQLTQLRTTADTENANDEASAGEKMFLPIKRSSFPANSARTIWEALGQKGFVVKEV